jgi:hypothetical protein
MLAFDDSVLKFFLRYPSLKRSPLVPGTKFTRNGSGYNKELGSF